MNSTPETKNYVDKLDFSNKKPSVDDAFAYMENKTEELPSLVEWLYKASKEIIDMLNPDNMEERVRRQEWAISILHKNTWITAELEQTA